MRKKMKQIRAYVDKSYGITCARLTDVDVIRLAQKYLLATSIENPRIAKAEAEELGITF